MQLTFYKKIILLAKNKSEGYQQITLHFKKNSLYNFIFIYWEKMHFEPVYIIVIIIAYLFGTFPSAKVIVKLLTGLDISNQGTGNIGTMNTYDVTGKRSTAMIVFTLDVLKGFLAIMATLLIRNNDFYAVSLAAAWVLLGHNYNVFLGFKGGRGLAAAVGVFLAINPFAIIMWVLMWISGYYIIKKDVHAGNAIACIATPIMLFSSPAEFIDLFRIMSFYEISEYRMLTLVLNLIILIRHIKPLKTLFKND